MRVLNGIAAFFWGNDIFISYSRSDTSNYAEQLAIILQEKILKCYIDKWGTQPGQKLSNQLKRILKQSSVFVILGSKDASKSIYISEEVQIFLKTKRTIVPINFGYLESATWFKSIEGLAVTVETNENLVGVTPSAAVIKRIENSLTYWKQTRRIRLVTGFFVTALFILICLIYLTSKQLNSIQNDKDLLFKERNSLMQQTDQLKNDNNKNLKNLSVLNDSIKIAKKELTETNQKLSIAKDKEKTSRAAANIFRNMNEDFTSNALLFMSQMSDSTLSTVEKARIDSVKMKTKKLIAYNDSSKTENSNEIKKFDKDSVNHKNRP